MIAEDGRDAAKQWLEGLKANGTTYDGNEAIIAAVNDGELDAGLIEHYYWYRLRDEVGADNLRARLYYFPPGDPGALVAISGAGALKSSEHAEAAQAFLRYLVSRRGQEIIANSKSYEYPLRPGVANPSLQRPFGAAEAARGEHRAARRRPARVRAAAGGRAALSGAAQLPDAAVARRRARGRARRARR